MHDSTTTSSAALLTLPYKQPYRINNCKFQNSIISFLGDLHSSKAYTDVVLYTAEGKTLQAHRIVLAAGSSYFNNLFKTVSPTTGNPQQSLVVALPSVKYKDLDRVVKFIYLGYLDIINSELEGFVNLAKQLGVVGMSDETQESDPPTLPEEQPPPPSEPPAHADLEEHGTHEDPYAPDHYDELQQQQYTLSSNASSSPQPPTLPNEFVQVSYTDDDEDLAGYALEDDEMDEDEDEENSDQGVTDNSVVHNARLFGGGGNEKPFVCVKCGKTYNSNKSLWRHKKFTCDEKIDFKCTICGKVFSRSDNLRRHVVVAHS